MSINKIIFQIGLLAFCVSAVIFATERMHLVEAVSRSFIVFVGVVLVSAAALMVVSTVGKKHTDAGSPQAPPERTKETAAADNERKRSS
jgi:hypothetical protein